MRDLLDLPYSADLDCYKLVRLALKRMAGIDVPDYRYPAGHAGRAAFLREVLPHWPKVERPRPLDVVLMLVDGRKPHIGLVVSRGRMLHTDSRVGYSRIERYDSGLWKVAGFYRVTP